MEQSRVRAVQPGQLLGSWNDSAYTCRGNQPSSGAAERRQVGCGMWWGRSCSAAALQSEGSTDSVATSYDQRAVRNEASKCAGIGDCTLDSRRTGCQAV